MPRKPLIRIGRPRNEKEVAALADAVDQSFASFGLGPDAAREWFEHLGHENLRVVRSGQQVAGGLGILNFGQFFGGRSVSSAGISCVAVSPEHRGAGLALKLMREVVAELACEGTALSVLYPSTWALYRGAGYEPSGARTRYRLKTHAFGTRERTLRMRPATRADHPAIHAVYRQRAMRTAGNVDRTAREWANIFRPLPEKNKYAYAIEARDGSLEGYVVYRQKSGEPSYEILVNDYAALTPAANRRLLGFFADHGTMVRHVVVTGGPIEPLAVMSREENLEIAQHNFWMLRMLNVPQALRARGYPPGLNAEIHFEIEDDLLPHNRGRFVLKIAGGRGVVRKGGRGRLKTTIRGLSPLYTGHMSAFVLRSTGQIEGPDEELATATAVFAGPAPWFNDGF